MVALQKPLCVLTTTTLAAAVAAAPRGPGLSES